MTANATRAISWFIWTGKEDVPLEQVCPWYRKRFSHEHGYRFLKQDLLWTQAHLRTPEQVERWSWMVACACNQLLLSKQLGLAVAASVGKPAACGHAATGSARDAEHFAAGWHTRSVAQTAWKIARMAQRPSQNTCATLSGGAQTQTGAKNAPQTGLMAS